MEQLATPIVLVLRCDHMVRNGTWEGRAQGPQCGGAWGNLPLPSGDTRPPIYLRRALCNGHLIEFYGVLIHLHATNGVKMLRDPGPIHSLNLIHTDFNVIRFSEV